MRRLTDQLARRTRALVRRSKSIAKSHVLPFVNERILARHGAKLVRTNANSIDFSLLLHGCRSALLRTMPKVSGTMLSAGCSGRWYFDWITERTGHSGRHLGIELYSPKPIDLPPNVEWIANSVGNMSGVSDISCDLVFSGQNVEHLWPEDTLGFLLESWRVLRRQGWLVIDSPNRLLTAPFVWSHPEHTIEFTPAEFKTLLELGGFEVSALKGIWLCRDSKTQQLLPLTPGASDGSWSLYERAILAEHDPDNSFLWWIEARRSDRRPDRDGMWALISDIFALAWPERSQRFLSQTGRIENQGNHRVIVSDPSQSGVLVFGPYMPLKPGHHRATFHIEVSGDGHSPVVRCDVLGAGGREIVVRMLTAEEVQSSAGLVSLEFVLPQLEFGIQARCLSLGGATVRCRCWPELI